MKMYWLPAYPWNNIALYWTGNVLILLYSTLSNQVALTAAKSQQQRRFNVAGKQEALLMDRKPENWPLFDEMLPDNVTTEVTQTVILPCSIINQGTHVVSWSRLNRHFNIISVGKLIFTPGERYSLPHEHGNSDWGLKIEHVKQGDAGVYECQIGTDPKSSRHVTLYVRPATKALLSKKNTAHSVNAQSKVPICSFMICLVWFLRTRIKD